ncbi:MAG: STAS domain-containing protein, partial [Xanthobacteraceae bacterium]
ADGSRHIVLRLKRVRNPDVVCLERLEQFLHDTEELGITVLLAGLRPEFLHAIERLRFQDWFAADRIFPEEDDVDSATLKAVRRAYELLADSNTCVHCVPARRTDRTEARLYYLV